MLVLDAVFEKSAPRVEEAPPADRPEICFVGRSNVGKSSALNVLTNRKQLARVSKTPGRTRLLNFFAVDIADRPGPNKRRASLRFCDLPGYGFARGPKDERRSWAAMIGAYLQQRESLAAIVVLIDAEVGPQPRDFEMMEFMRGASRPFIIAATKADKLPRTRRGAVLDKLANMLEVPRGTVFAFSSHEDIGRRQLWNAMCAAAGVFGVGSEHVIAAVEEEVDESEAAMESP